jgi:thiol-disulfide isomerase/thioredoxin
MEAENITKNRKIHRFLVKFYRFSCFLIALSMPVSQSHAAAAIDTSIRLASIDDTSHTLDEFIGSGKWVILNFWGTDCPPCQEEIPELVQYHDAHKRTNAYVVGIAIDFPSFQQAKKQEVKRFADSYLIDYPVLLGDGSVTNDMGLGDLQALPTTYIFSPMGKLTAIKIGSVTRSDLEDYIQILSNNNQPLND